MNMLLLASLIACTGASDSTETPTPTVTFVSPHEGDSFPAGDIGLSIAVDGFLLSDPAKHNDGEPTGYLQVDWTDGTTSDSLQTGSTTPTIRIDTAGSWTLTAGLYFADGDGMDEEFADFVPATVGITVVAADTGI